MKNHRSMLHSFPNLLRLSFMIVLLLIGCSLAIAQHRKGGSPSPAAHGMMLPQDEPSKPSRHKHDPMRAENPRETNHIPEKDPNLEDPNAGVGPRRDDPNAGDGPVMDDGVTDDVGQDDVPTSTDDEPDLAVQPQSPNLQPKITQWEIFKVAPASDFGKPGDLLLVLKGMHFLEAESQPIVHLGDKIALDEVVVGENGTELFAVLPLLQLPQILREGFQRICLQNPGGKNRDPKEWAWLPVAPSAFAKAVEQAEEGKLARGPFFMKLQK